MRTSEQKRAYMRAWNAKNIEHVLAWRKAYHLKHRDRINSRKRRTTVRFYGITFEDYDALFAEQGGVCAICEQPEKRTYKGRVRRLAVDHDHLTGTVRALLCQDCNLAIGFLDDDAELVRKAADYLDKFGTEQIEPEPGDLELPVAE